MFTERVDKMARMFTADYSTAKQSAAPSRTGRAGRHGRVARHFPLIMDNANARRCVRVIAGWTLRWSPDFGQVVKLGSPFDEDGPDGGQAEAVFG